MRVIAPFVAASNSLSASTSVRPHFAEINQILILHKLETKKNGNVAARAAAVKIGDYDNWDGLAVGTALWGAMVIIGENVCDTELDYD